jgi:hypothetical protein
MSSLIGTFMNASSAAIAAWRTAWLDNDPQQAWGGGTAGRGSYEWDLWQARTMRYRLYWALYQNSAYHGLGLTGEFKKRFGLAPGSNVRHIFNPAARVGDFYQTHLMGGELDPKAGDGESELSCLPILTEHQAIRPAIATLWEDSWWQVQKDLFTLQTAVLGESAIRIVDDTSKGAVRLEIEHPGHLKWVDFDHANRRLNGYIIQKYVFDPRQEDIKDADPNTDPLTNRRLVRYTEKAWLDGNKVSYQTLLDGAPYAWDGEDSSWDAPYGFIPLVVGHFKQVGTLWAENAFHGGLSRFVEVDNQASCLSDGNIRDFKAPHFIAGAQAPAAAGPGIVGPSGPGAGSSVDATQSTLDSLGFIYGPIGSSAIPLTNPRDIPGMVAHIASMLDDIEKQYPELLADTGDFAGRVTAEAIRNARQRATAKVRARRIGPDSALVDAHRYAMAIGGFRGYKGYKGLGLDDLAAGRLDHAIGQRPVFDIDPTDTHEEDLAFWTAIQFEVAAGVPIEYALERAGWTAKELADLDKAKARKAAQSAAAVAAQGPVPNPESTAGAEQIVTAQAQAQAQAPPKPGAKKP